MDTIDVAAPDGPRKAQGCCEGSSQYLFSTSVSQDERRSLYVLHGRVILGERDWATPLSLAPGDAGALTIGVAGGRGRVEAADGSLHISETGMTPFKLEAVSDAGELFRLKTQDGSYVSVSAAGAAVSLTADQAAAAVFSLDPSGPQVQPRFAAEDVNDERLSTHLWIFNRVYNMIVGNRDLGRNKDELQQCIRDAEFVKGIRQGIFDADNGSSEYQGIVYSAHFYHPEKKVGGYWDPSNDPINFGKNNALYYGTYYFDRAVSASDPYASGFNLGLAIHYLQDLAQPMHCGLFPNNPVDLTGSGPLGYRHENYELWVLGIHQGPAYRLDAGDLHLAEFQGWPIEKYWQSTAERGLAVFRRWQGSTTSPIGSAADGKKGDNSHKPRPFGAGRPEWATDAGEMLKLAQRMVAGLLFAWADSPSAMVSKIRGTARPNDVVLVSPSQRVVARAPGSGDDSNQVYSGFQSMPGSFAWWNLEPVLDGGQQVYEGEGAQRSPVYYIRNKQTGKYMVAGETYDGHVYHQPHQNRLNAQWIVERALDTKTGQPLEYRHKNNTSYSVYWVRDRARAHEHKAYYLSTSYTNGTGPLRDDALRESWVQIPAASW